MLLKEIAQRASTFNLAESALPALGFPKAFTRTLHKQANINDDAFFTPIKKSQLKPETFKKNVIAIKFADGTFGLMRAWDNDEGGSLTIMDASGKTLEVFNGSPSALFKKAKAISNIFISPFNNGFVSRSHEQSAKKREALRSEAGEFMKYMNDTFGARLRAVAERAAAEIYAKIPKLDKTADAFMSSKSAAEKALAQVNHIENIADKGFNEETLRYWIKQVDGWGSTWTNMEKFNHAMKTPNARAEFAKAVIDQIKLSQKIVRELPIKKK